MIEKSQNLHIFCWFDRVGKSIASTQKVFLKKCCYIVADLTAWLQNYWVTAKRIWLITSNHFLWFYNKPSLVTKHQKVAITTKPLTFIALQELYLKCFHDSLSITSKSEHSDFHYTNYMLKIEWWFSQRVVFKRSQRFWIDRLITKAKLFTVLLN